MVARIVDLRKGKQATARTRPLPLRDAPAPRRQSPLRARRRRARLALLGSILLIGAVIVYGIHLASYSRYFTIGTITVAGVEKIAPDIISSYVESALSDGSFHFFSRRNIFLYPKDVIEMGIAESFPRVRSARLSRPEVFSRELIVTIEEREPYALWCATDADCYAMDDTGFVFTTAATSTNQDFETQYIFSGGVSGGPIGSEFVPGQLPSVLALLRILQQQTNLIPVRIDVQADQDFHVSVTQGFYIKASFGQEPEAIAQNLGLVLASDALRDRLAEIEYVDLRFGNRVYYKMNSGESESEEQNGEVQTDI